MKLMVFVLVTMLLCSCMAVQGRVPKETVVKPDSYVDNHHNIPRQNYNSQGGGSGGDAGDNTDNGTGWWTKSIPLRNKNVCYKMLKGLLIYVVYVLALSNCTGGEYYLLKLCFIFALTST